MKQLSLSRDNIIALSVCFALFLLKNVGFHWFAYFAWLPAGETGLWAVLAWSLPKIGSALLLASLVLLIKRKIWMIIPALALDTWCIGNLIYMRNNNYLLDSFAFSIAGNMNGYWWSTLLFIEWGLDLMIYATSIIACAVFLRRKAERSPLWFAVCVLACVALHYVSEGCYLLSKPAEERPAFRWDIATRESREQIYGVDYEYLVQETSLLTMPIYLLPDHLEIKAHKVYDRSMTDADCAIADALIGGERQLVSNSPLIIITLESFENWVCRPEVMPNLYRLTQQKHVLYAERVKPQIVGAASADGQMIINTGVLPVTEGYTCFRYPTDEFPALMKLTRDSTLYLMPNDTSVWNQTMMSPAYGYKHSSILDEADTCLFGELDRALANGVTHIQVKTQSTHAPFVGCEESTLVLPDDMPFFMSRYMRAFNATDAAMGKLLQRLETDTVLRQYTVVITGDHQILYPKIRRDYQRYCDKHNLEYSPIEPFVPFVVYSPAIEGNVHRTDTCLQMDIYPTLLHLIGGDDYYWQGFGEDLLRCEDLSKRKISGEEAARLSDLMLRNDYWRE